MCYVLVMSYECTWTMNVQWTTHGKTLHLIHPQRALASIRHVCPNILFSVDCLLQCICTSYLQGVSIVVKLTCLAQILWFLVTLDTNYVICREGWIFLDNTILKEHMSVKENREIFEMFKNILDLDIESSKLSDYLTDKCWSCPYIWGLWPAIGTWTTSSCSDSLWSSSQGPGKAMMEKECWARDGVINTTVVAKEELMELLLYTNGKKVSMDSTEASLHFNPVCI